MSKEIKNNVDYSSSKIPKTHGFSVPKNYFENIEDSVISKRIEEQLPKENGFNVSEDYFEALDNQIFSKIEFPKKETKVVQLRKRMLRFIPTAAAASVLLFFGLNYFSSTNATSFDNINVSDIENWFEEGNFDDNLTNEIFVDTDFTDSNTFEDQTISDEEILEYFNTIDNTTILTEIES